MLKSPSHRSSRRADSPIALVRRPEFRLFCPALIDVDYDAGMDVLSGLIANIRLRAMFIGPSHMSAPWGVHFEWPPPFEKMPPPPPPMDRIPRDIVTRTPADVGGGVLSCVTEGTIVYEVDGSQPITLQAGDIFIIPRVRSHSLKDHSRTVAQPLWRLIPSPHDRHSGLQINGGGAVSSFIHGLLLIEDSDRIGLLDALPPYIVLRGTDGRFDRWALASIELLKEELTVGAGGANAVVSHLASVIFIRALRTHLQTRPLESESDLKALADSDIGPVVAMVNARPEFNWSVVSMAETAMMSRSVFAERFVELVGTPPMQYVSRVRMKRAAELLADGASVKEVAMRIGYDSEAAFSTAYKRQFGHTPGNTPKRDATSVFPDLSARR